MRILWGSEGLLSGLRLSTSRVIGVGVGRGRTGCPMSGTGKGTTGCARL